jgi:signal transduction histidine kinase/HD-like signal output (HDOD) protein
MERPVGKSGEAIDVRRLPVFPHVLLRLLEKSHLPDTSFEELAEIIQTDPVLTSKFFAIYNFPAYSENNPASNLKQLLVMMGLDTIKSIAVTSAVNQMFTRRDEVMDVFVESFWQTSLKSAFIAEQLAQQINYKPLDEAYFCGLLHRVGQLVLQKKTNGGYVRLASIDLGNRRDAVERESFGVSAAEIGALLIKNWDNQSFMSDAVLYQSESVDAILDASRLVKLINLTSKLVKNEHLIDTSVIEDGHRLFNLDEQQIVNAVSAADDRLSAVMQDLLLPAQVDDNESSGFDGVESSTQILSVKQVRRELTKRVRDIAMLDGARQLLEKNSDLDGILSSIQKNLYVLFGLMRNLCFLYDPQSESLIGTKSSDQWSGINELEVALVPGRSLMAEAVLRKTIVHSLDPQWSQSLSILDQQLIKLTGSEEILYLPLISRQTVVGILAIGINSAIFSSLKSHINQMVLFAGEVADVIQRHQNRSQDFKEMLESERTRREGHLKELIHEAGNPLGIINNYLEILGIQLGEEHPVQDQLHIIKEEIERVGDILRQMRETPEKEEVPVGMLDLNAFISELVKIFRASISARQNIEIELQLDQNLDPIHSNRNSLKQIFTNLIKNAFEAMEKSGTITITTRGQVNVDGKHFVEIMVSDQGPGVPDEVMEHLFNPVASAKGKNHSGLGLTIVRNLVADLHGSISCRTSKGIGTEFRILIPH